MATCRHGSMTMDSFEPCRTVTSAVKMSGMNEFLGCRRLQRRNRRQVSWISSVMYRKFDNLVCGRNCIQNQKGDSDKMSVVVVWLVGIATLRCNWRLVSSFYNDGSELFFLRPIRVRVSVEVASDLRWDSLCFGSTKTASLLHLTIKTINKRDFSE